MDDMMFTDQLQSGLLEILLVTVSSAVTLGFTLLTQVVTGIISAIFGINTGGGIFG